MTDRIYPQFATHNAHTMAAVLHMAAGPRRASSFSASTAWATQLHAAVREAARHSAAASTRRLARIQDLLAYLVRRLLENGANSSFVNQIVTDEERDAGGDRARSASRR